MLSYALRLIIVGFCFYTNVQTDIFVLNMIDERQTV